LSTISTVRGRFLSTGESLRRAASTFAGRPPITRRYHVNAVRISFRPDPLPESTKAQLRGRPPGANVEGVPSHPGGRNGAGTEPSTMTGTGGQSPEEERPNELPPPLAGILRPELPSLADEIIKAIRDRIPEYARPIDGPYGQIMRTGVEQALTSFVDLVADPSRSPADRDEVARMLGRHEAEEGRSLDSLQMAYRIGAQLAWHRVMEVGREASLSSSVISTLADAMFGYMNDLATLSLQGYQELKARSAGEQQAARRRLLQLILNRDDPVPLRALADLAETAGWPLPEEVVAVAVTQASSGEGGSAEPFGDNDILAGLDDPQPHLLLPGQPAEFRWPALGDWLDGRRGAIGLTVPLAEAA